MADNSMEDLHVVQIYIYVLLLVNSHTIYHVTHPPLLFQKQLVFDVIIVQTLKEQPNINFGLYLDRKCIAKINLHQVSTDNNDFINCCFYPTCKIIA